MFPASTQAKLVLTDFFHDVACRPKRCAVRPSTVDYNRVWYRFIERRKAIDSGRYADDYAVFKLLFAGID